MPHGGFGAMDRVLPLMPSLHRRRLQCYLALMLADIAALFFSFATVGYAYLGQRGVGQSLLLAQLLLPVFLTVALYNGAYANAALQRAYRSVSRVLLALLISASVVVFVTFYTKSSAEFSRVDFTCGVALAMLVLVRVRLWMRGFVRWRCGDSVFNELVIDDGGPVVRLKGAYHISAPALGLTPDLDNPHALDTIGVVMQNADRVIVSTPPERRAAWAIVLKSANVLGEVIDETVAELAAQGARIAGAQGFLQVSVGPLGLRDRITKRGFDVALSALVLALLAPLLLAVALAITLEDGGPPLFIQRRVGRGNRFFLIYKFRSMQVRRASSDGAQSAARDDTRITRVGQLIRSTSIDELPQLLNVLKGDMSLVGPRPHAIASHAGDKLFWEVDERYWLRHALKPGLTGLAQVRGLRGATDSEQDLASRLNADLEYLNGWSIWRDLWIIMATLRVLVHDRAY